MLEQAGQRDVEGPGEFADRGRAVLQPLEDVAPRWVRQCREGTVEDRIPYHLVNFSPHVRMRSMPGAA